MTRTVIFVHGTGVRGESFAHTFNQVKSQLSRMNSALTLSPCFWGDTEGVKLRMNGASIPDYEETGGDGVPSDEDQKRALWAVLSIDSWYELRLLGDRAIPKIGFVPGQRSPSELLTKHMTDFEPTPLLIESLADVGLASFFTQAHADLIASDEFAAAVKTSTLEFVVHRQALARGLLARTMSLATEAGRPQVAAVTRDVLLKHLFDELEAQGLFLGRLKNALAGVAKRWVVGKVARKRGLLSDGAAPLAGDVLLYQTRGQGIRDYIAGHITPHAQNSVTLIAHSLGGIACLDMLVQNKFENVDRLVTVGSQAPILYELDTLTSLRFGEPLPAHFPQWLNIFDRQDLLSYQAKPVFNDARIQDVEVDNGLVFPDSHSAYWDNPEVWKSMTRFI